MGVSCSRTMSNWEERASFVQTSARGARNISYSKRSFTSSATKITVSLNISVFPRCRCIKRARRCPVKYHLIRTSAKFPTWQKHKHGVICCCPENRQCFRCREGEAEVFAVYFATSPAPPSTDCVLHSGHNLRCSCASPPHALR